MSALSFRKINNVKVTPIKVKTLKPEEILGYDLIPLDNAIVFVCGKKGSGKTNVMFKILEECTDASTIIYVFCSTINSDKNWLKIKNWLIRRGNPTEYFTCIHENKSSNLKEFIEQIKSEDEEEARKNEEKKEKPKEKISDPFNLFDKEEEEEKNVSKRKKEAPKYFVIFDDISNDLRSKKDVQELLKHMRHLHTKIVISSLYPSDLDPPSRCQVDIWALFKGFGEEKLKDIFPQLDLRDIEFDQFWSIYKLVTKEKHDFLYIDRDTGQLRRNFDEMINFNHIIKKQS